MFPLVCNHHLMTLDKREYSFLDILMNKRIHITQKIVHSYNTGSETPHILKYFRYGFANKHYISNYFPLSPYLAWQLSSNISLLLIKTCSRTRKAFARIKVEGLSSKRVIVVTKSLVELNTSILILFYGKRLLALYYNTVYI